MTRWRDLLTASSAEGERAAQLVEFAVALPLLVVFVVGIFDFSNALTLKQRLTDMARQAARAAAADPSNDLQGVGTNPVSVTDVFYIVDNYLIANNLNDCGLIGSPATALPGLTWKFTATAGGCPSPGLILTVNRGYYYPATGGAVPSTDCRPQNVGVQTSVISTCVSIQYPYDWRFGRAASLLGFSTVLPQQISAVAVTMNEN